MKLVSMSVFIVLSMLSAASAQQVVGPGQFRIGGVPFQCGGALTLLHPFGGDVATADFRGINLNWPMYSSLPNSVKAFIYAHECAHLLYGPKEDQADCWAIQIGRAQGFLKRRDLAKICQAVWLSPGDWTHFPGPVRCQNMIACFDNLGQ